MVRLTTKQDCANFLKTKKAQGFISEPTWKSIQEEWSDCSSLEEHIALTKAVFKQIAFANRIIPMSYML